MLAVPAHRSSPTLVTLHCLLLFAWVGCAHPDGRSARGTEAPKPESGAAVVLNGQQVDVRWSDGDSFKFKSGPYKGRGVRLAGYNTLESYGPVHRWGSWTAAELYAIARTSKDRASERIWQCTTDGSGGGYGRVLVDCPGVAEHLVLANLSGVDSHGVWHVRGYVEMIQNDQCVPAAKPRILSQTANSLRVTGSWGFGHTAAAFTMERAIAKAADQGMAIAALVDELELFGMGASWGGYESLILPQDPNAFRSVTPWPYEGQCVRFHIGLEDPDDLIADLSAGFKRLKAAM